MAAADRLPSLLSATASGQVRFGADTSAASAACWTPYGEEPRAAAAWEETAPLVGTERGLLSPLIPVTLEGQPRGLSAREFCQRGAAAGVAAVMLSC